MKYSMVLIACACAAIASPAIAKQCPSGQILRVSKGVCMDKTDALKTGVIASRDTNRARMARLSERQVSPMDGQAREETIVAKSRPPEPSQRDASTSEALGYAARPSDQVATNRVSPYGALNLDYFGPR